VCFGGGGPLHAVELAADLEIPRVLIPPAPGVSSALGLLTAEFRHDYVRTVLRSSRYLELPRLRTIFRELASTATQQMESEGVGSKQILFLPSVDMRYVGQGYSLSIHFHLDELLQWQNLDECVQRFHQAHAAAYGYHDEGEATELVNARLAAIGQLLKPNLPRLQESNGSASAVPKGSRLVQLNGRQMPAAIYERTVLQRGSVVRGPAIIEQLDSTTLLFPDQVAKTDVFGNLHISLEGIE
jgi:N-methylhydantoinase A